MAAGRSFALLKIALGLLAWGWFSSASAEPLNIDIQPSVGYRMENITNFSNQPRKSRVLEFAVNSQMRLPELPLAVGYHLSFPLADAGSDDIGIEKGLEFNNGLYVQGWHPVSPEWSVFGQFTYIFYGYTELEATADLEATQRDGSLVRIPDADIFLSYRTNGIAFDLGGQMALDEQMQLLVGFSRRIFMRHLDSFKLTEVDQNHLIESSFDRSIANNNKLFVGLSRSL